MSSQYLDPYLEHVCLQWYLLLLLICEAQLKTVQTALAVARVLLFPLLVFSISVQNPLGYNICQHLCQDEEGHIHPYC